MSNTNIGDSSTFQNLINLVKLNTVGISQVGIGGGVASLDNSGKVPASQLPDMGQSQEYRYNIVTKSTGNYDAAITINKYLNNELVSSIDYIYTTFDRTHVIIDNFFDMYYGDEGRAEYKMTLLENSTIHQAGYVNTQGYNEIVDFSETFIIEATDLSYIAPPFSSSTPYAVEDLLTHNGAFQKCTTPHTGIWNGADFTETSVEEILNTKLNASKVGVANGVASLDAYGKVPTSQIPGTVDEIKEGYLNSTDGKFYEEDTYTTEIPAATDKIYVDLSTNKTYRWGGSAYVEISESLALGETSSTAYAGNKGKANADAIAAIKDGTNIDSFSDVETALDNYMKKGVDYVTAGQKTGTTLGNYATTEGINTAASGYAGHAEGSNTAASASCAHAEGDHSLASHSYSHAEGSYTKTGNSTQHVSGKYNEGKSDTAFEIGNGTADNARSNAFEVDQNGDVIAAGDVMDGSGNTLADVATLSGYVADMSDEIDDIETALDGKANVEKRYSYGDNWSTKTWTGLTSFYGRNVWSDGTDIYYSDAATQYVLDKATSTWSVKTWNLNFDGSSTWTDGTDIYYSYGSKQYVLDKATSTWSVKTWNGLTSFYGYNIWTDGTDIYYSDGYYSAQYVLDKATSTWSVKTWTGLTDFDGSSTWTDGTNIYYSSVSNQYVLNKATSTWSVKTWNGLTSFNGNNIWTDGTDIYYSYDGSTQYVLDKATSTWSVKTWTGLTNFSGRFIWTDGTDIYYSSITNQYVLNKIEGAVVIENSITVKLNGDVAAAGSITAGPGGLILPINPSTTPTANGAIQIETT